MHRGFGFGGPSDGMGGYGASVAQLIAELTEVVHGGSGGSSSGDPFCVQGGATIEALTQLNERLALVQNGQHTRRRRKRENTARRERCDLQQRLWTDLRIVLLCVAASESELSGVRLSDLCRLLTGLLPDQNDSPDIMCEGTNRASRIALVSC